MSYRGFISLVCGAAAFVLLAHPAAAGPGYHLNGFRTSPANTPALLAAMDKLQSADIMKQSKGRVLLLANLADGDDPATHAFSILFKSVAEYEAFGMKLQRDPAWAEFMGVLSKLGEGAGTTRYATVRSWGDLSDDDVVWQAIARRVHNPGAYLAAIDRFMNGKTGKAFPGQVHLNQVVAGGGPVTHTTIIGYKSEAEMESWADQVRGNPDWHAFLAEIGLSSDPLGTGLSRTIKAWGPKSIKDLYGR